MIREIIKGLVKWIKGVTTSVLNPKRVGNSEKSPKRVGNSEKSPQWVDNTSQTDRKASPIISIVSQLGRLLLINGLIFKQMHCSYIYYSSYIIYLQINPPHNWVDTQYPHNCMAWKAALGSMKKVRGRSLNGV